MYTAVAFYLPRQFSKECSFNLSTLFARMTSSLTAESPTIRSFKSSLVSI
jgi:hypothetical protein